MKEKFKDARLTGQINIKMSDTKGYWTANKQAIVNYIISICENFNSNGDILTLRQLYYQLVAKDLIPNHDKVYKKIGSIKDDIVYSGLVDWNTFEDRGRVPHRAYFEEDVAGALERAVKWYALDKQDGQKTHIEVWTEKDAISGILKKVTNRYTIRLVVNKGYSSSTAMYQAYDRFLHAIEDGQKVKILYFGDHDPSGMDMIRDINDRIMFMLDSGERFDKEYNGIADRMYMWWEREGLTVFDVAQLGERYENVPDLIEGENEKQEALFDEGKRKLFIQDNDLFEVRHIGLTMAQIELYNPPHNPAKMTDPRAKWYIEKYGQRSWEVDALDPKVMREIVEDEIVSSMDMETYETVLKQQENDIKEITQIIKDLN